MTLGSLFDGIGGFPFCAVLSGVTPVWAAEVDSACVAVTKRHFPTMTHLGDVSKINGAEIPPVDIVTFGSPCQDLSVAGARKGIKHADNGSDETTRSGLFIDAIRIVYEMREATNGRYPTYIVWENVEGAFNSNGGRDFQIGGDEWGCSCCGFVISTESSREHAISETQCNDYCRKCGAKMDGKESR